MRHRNGNTERKKVSDDISGDYSMTASQNAIFDHSLSALDVLGCLEYPGFPQCGTDTISG